MNNRLVDIVDWAITSPEFRKIIAEHKEIIQETQIETHFQD
jgi:hypothetical protein